MPVRNHPLRHSRGNGRAFPNQFLIHYSQLPNKKRVEFPASSNAFLKKGRNMSCGKLRAIPVFARQASPNRFFSGFEDAADRQDVIFRNEGGFSWRGDWRNPGGGDRRTG
jgi:hypothetical protein